MLVSKIEKDLKCVVCGKKERTYAYPDEDETVCIDCLDVYMEHMSKYLKRVNFEKEPEHEHDER